MKFANIQKLLLSSFKESTDNDLYFYKNVKSVGLYFFVIPPQEWPNSLPGGIPERLRNTVFKGQEVLISTI